jgi:2-polyprenyl-6-methoxyphenol hydroxylase-like FAD-dependent oxidoreductase
MSQSYQSGDRESAGTLWPVRLGVGHVAHIVVLGGGVAGLSTAMLLASDSHQVTVLERDAATPPPDPDGAWTEWERRGVNQFRMLHFFLPRFRQLVEQELPTVAAALERAGALRFNFIKGIPAEMTGGFRSGDDDFEVLTGRRPVVESAIAGAAAQQPGATVRRGVAVAGLVTGPQASPGIPQVVGVRDEAGVELSADLVVDASGRRSALPRWLEAIGARPCEEQLEDSGFVYYGRHFRSSDGSVPPIMGPLLSHFESVSILTLPADNGTWGVGIISVAGDAEVRGLRSVERWDSAIKAFPLIAHWADGEPLEDEVAVMAKIEDRRRRFVIDGRPIATGVVAVADAWACTNPSLGRGATMGLMHAIELRNLLRRHSTDDPVGFALAWAAATEASVEPWYRDTLHFDRHRLAQAGAQARGQPYEPGDQAWEMVQGLQYAAMRDPDALRGFLSVVGLLATEDEVFGRPGMTDKVLSVGAGWRDGPVFGPDRAELVKLINE